MKTVIKSAAILIAAFCYLLFITGDISDQTFYRSVITLLMMIFIAAMRRQRVTS